MFGDTWAPRPLNYRQRAVKAFYSEPAEVRQSRSDYYRDLIRKVTSEVTPEDYEFEPMWEG